MFLKSLNILNDASIINQISFHKGINLIVDETQENPSLTTTGNNVGKTTVLRLVDYCFGGDGKNIYKDTEFTKQPNNLVEDFLKKNNIIIEVELVEDLDNPNSETVLIRRNFLQRNQKIQEVNGINITDKSDFDKKLKQLILKSEVDKPTFRQIISKNIRDEKNKMTNIVKVLPAFATSEVYEALYLFWLGIDTTQLDQKQILSEDKKKEVNFQKMLKKEGELPLVNQQLTFIIDKLKELNYRKSLFVTNENYGKEIDELNKTKTELNSKSTLLSRLEVRQALINESKSDLEKEHSQIDASQIKSLYEKANSLIPMLQITFEDTLKFHNKLIAEKLKYITRELPELEQLIFNTKAELKTLERHEKFLMMNIEKSEFTEDLQLIMFELNKLSLN